MPAVFKTESGSEWEIRDCRLTRRGAHTRGCPVDIFDEPIVDVLTPLTVGEPWEVVLAAGHLTTGYVATIHWED